PVGGCKDNGSANAFCIQIDSNGLILNGDSLTFTITILGGTLLPNSGWDIQSLVTGCAGGGNDCTRIAVSQPIGGGRVIPEPASIMLLGSGLLGAGTLLRRRIKL